MFREQNFCHIASNNRNNVKVGVFVYRTSDDLATVTVSGYFNERIIDINLHDIIIHEKINPVDSTVVQRNTLCVTKRTIDNVETKVIQSKWEEDIDQYIEDTFVKKDGSSTMTGPLKFETGAIAGGTNGLDFFKSDSQGNLTQIASLSDTQFVPQTNNTMEIGSSAKKIKKIYVDKINNGYDIDVPVTNGPETMALKSEVDLAANSGRMITDQGVWYAKMYAPTVPPVEAEVEGRNYADFSQVDGNGDPIIVIYTYTSGAWTLTETIIPPAAYDGYVPVTSKIWDIPEQTGQQGGRILWNHQSKEFTPYPQIISFENINVTGESTVNMPVTPVPTQIANVNYVDNKVATAQGLTNCITEIPQDIKIEINAGVLTLKTGSKVYKPNGVGVFDEITVASDVVYNFGSATGTFFVFDTGATFQLVDCVSGTTDSLAGQSYHVWYDTPNNLIKLFGADGNTPLGNISFPLGIVSVTSGSVDSIDQIFNGFGYIGSTVFALPGVKGLIPNGRNSDGTLKNIPITLSSVTTHTANTTGTNNVVILSDGSINIAGITYWIYDEHKNIWVHNSNTISMVSVGISEHNVEIKSFIPKTVFHAVDTNDINQILAVMYPIGALYMGTQNTCPMSIVMPGTVWTQVTGRYLLASGTLAGTSENYSAGNTVAAGSPNITGNFGSSAAYTNTGSLDNASGAFQSLGNANGHDADGGSGIRSYGLSFDASRSSSVYGQSATVRAPAYVVNVWVRTA